jgi:nicotinate-nucleotide adenylyltransferase
MVIGILGGTFDPIHYGHLRPAAEVLRALSLSEVRFVPAARPPHRPAPVAEWVHRLHMLQLATAPERGFRVDEREAQIPGPSYTVRTLESMRAEFGQARLCLLMGSDAFRGLTSWFQWERLLDFAHIAVMERPGSPMRTLEASLPAWVHGRLCREPQALERTANGLILLQRVEPQNISASAIRADIAAGRSVREMLPPAVWDYIRSNQLYGYKHQGA